MTCSRRWRGNWSKGTVLVRPPTPSGEPSTQNTKSCFQRLLAARMKPHQSKCRAFCGKLSLTLRVLLKGPWSPRLLSSSDSDRKLCPVRSGADGHLSQNRRLYSASVDLKSPSVGRSRCPPTLGGKSSLAKPLN